MQNRTQENLTSPTAIEDPAHPSRRRVIVGGGALALTAASVLAGCASDGGGSATAASSSAATTTPTPAKPLHILILGGTGFTGPHQVRYALSRGHKVTIFNRGRRPKEWPASVEELVGDREKNEYDALKGKKFDVCIDNPTSVPHWIRDAANVLRGNVNHFIFISTLSVYASNANLNEDENGARAKYEGADAMAETMASLRKNMALYGPLKALSEDETFKQFPNMATVIRPGLIVGPGDETDRFTYWPVRVARGGKTLVPPSTDPVKYIDARDLAEWTIRMAERRAAGAQGAYNAIGPRDTLTMGALLKTMRETTGKKADFVEAPLAFLEENKVSAWADLPLWIPGSGQNQGFHRRSNAKAIAAGLTFRSVETTTQDTVAWWNSLDEKRRAAPRAGLKPEREMELLAKLSK
jgi:2'-hydroxyisoflavone reductase